MNKPRTGPGFRTAALAAVAALALVAAGCGDDGSSSTSSSAPAASPGAGSNTEAAIPAPIKGVPKALAANRAQANQILEEGSLDGKLEELRGHPVVVNQWASWCPPCRAEFPYFQESAEAHAKEIAFVGIDMQDERAAAEEFLASQPVPYPSIDDPNAEQIGSLGGGIVSPTTVFIDAKGEIQGVFQGGYADRDQLEADIDKYLG